jgi:hypothetical protein
MAKAKKSNKAPAEKPLKIKGEFLEVFKVVKKNKEENAKKTKRS